MIQFGTYTINPAVVAAVTIHESTVREFMTAVMQADGRNIVSVLAERASAAHALYDEVATAVAQHHAR